MAYSQTSSERGVNDILSSIRQIISEDIHDEIKEQGPHDIQDSFSNRAAFEDISKRNSSNQVLELTRLIKDDGSVINLTSEEKIVTKMNPSSSLENEESLEQVQLPQGLNNDFSTLLNSKDFDVPSSQEKKSSTMASEDLSSSDTFLSSHTMQESAAAFAELARATQRANSPRKPPTVDTVGEYTVDTLMRELLLKLLKEWLDTHLPSLVRTVVAEQIEKVLQQQSETNVS